MNKIVKLISIFALAATACLFLSGCNKEDDNPLANTKWSEAGQTWNLKVDCYDIYIFDSSQIQVYDLNNHLGSGWDKKLLETYKYKVKGQSFTYTDAAGKTKTAHWTRLDDGRLQVLWTAGSGSPQQVWFPLEGEVLTLFNTAPLQ